MALSARRRSSSPQSAGGQPNALADRVAARPGAACARRGRRALAGDRRHARKPEPAREPEERRDAAPALRAARETARGCCSGWRGSSTAPIPRRPDGLAPVYGDLSNLPPVLVHASEAECYSTTAAATSTAHARPGSAGDAAGRWSHMVHAWHLFDPELPEAVEVVPGGRQVPRRCGARCAREDCSA